MFSLFFTIHADDKQEKGKPERAEGVPGKRRFFTWALVALWCILISFGIISLSDPKWLEDLSRSGAKIEARWFRDYGDNHLRAGRYRLAIVQYERALQIDPDNVAAMVNQAIAYNRAGYPDRAEQVLKNALEIETYQKGVIYFNLADLLQKEGRKDEAIRCYEQAIDAEPEPAYIYRELGIFYLRAQQYEEARQAFQMALDTETDLTSSYQNMLRNSISVFEDDTTNLRIIKSQLARDIRTEDLARYDPEIVELMKQRDPGTAKTHNLLGLAYVRLGDADSAIAHFEKSLQILPGNREIIKNLQLAREFKRTGQVPAPSE
jgi:tetratricopeptide (TPR) repeat protein